MNDQRTVRFVVNATTEPKQITWVGWEGVNEKITEQHFNGIYKLDGDRLTIAYRKDGPRPERFESPHGSGVTLFELERPKPTTSPEPGRTKTGKSQVLPSPAKTPTLAGGKAEPGDPSDEGNWLNEKTWPTFVAPRRLEITGTDGAVTKLRKERFNAGQRELRDRYIYWLQGEESLPQVYDAVRRVVEARMEAGGPQSDKAVILREKVAFAKLIEKQAEQLLRKFKKARQAADVPTATYYCAAAELELLHAETKTAKEPAAVLGRSAETKPETDRTTITYQVDRPQLDVENSLPRLKRIFPNVQLSAFPKPSYVTVWASPVNQKAIAAEVERLSREGPMAAQVFKWKGTGSRDQVIALLKVAFPSAEIVPRDNVKTIELIPRSNDEIVAWATQAERERIETVLRLLTQLTKR